RAEGEEGAHRRTSVPDPVHRAAADAAGPRIRSGGEALPQPGVEQVEAVAHGALEERGHRSAFQVRGGGQRWAAAEEAGAGASAGPARRPRRAGGAGSVRAGGRRRQRRAAGVVGSGGSSSAAAQASAAAGGGAASSAAAAAAVRSTASASALRSADSGLIPRSHQSRSRSKDQAVAHPISGRKANRSASRPAGPQRGR